MNVSTRSYLIAPIAAMVATCVALAPSIAPPPDVAVPANSPAPTRVLSKATVELLAAVRGMSPTVPAAVLPSGTPAAAVTAAPTPQNAASDFIINAWFAVLPWIDYGVNLTDYVLSFIPYGYLIGDQVSIVYYSLVRPVANSFVVDLVAPVVNDPLNIFSYTNGLIAVGSVTVTSLINLGINEFNYFFGWLIPPLPPIPPIGPFAAGAEQAVGLAAPIEAAAAETSSDLAPGKVKRNGILAETVSDVAEGAVAVVEKKEDAAANEEKTPLAAKESEEKVSPKERKTTSAPGTVQAQGEVRESSQSSEKTADATNSSPHKGDKGEKPDTATGAAANAGDAGSTNADTGAKKTKGGAGEK